MIIICLQPLKKLDKNFLKIKTQFFKKEESTNELYQTFKRETTTLNNICQKIQKVHVLTHFIYFLNEYDLRVYYKLQNVCFLLSVIQENEAMSPVWGWEQNSGSRPG